jgi:hypothetical protein
MLARSLALLALGLMNSRHKTIPSTRAPIAMPTEEMIAVFSFIFHPPMEWFAKTTSILFRLPEKMTRNQNDCKS